MKLECGNTVVLIILIALAVFSMAQTRDTTTPRTHSQVQAELGKLDHIERTGEAKAYLKGAIDALRWQSGSPNALAPSTIVQSDGKGVGE